MAPVVEQHVCPICRLVEVLEYARTELARLEGASKIFHVEERHRPQKFIIDRLQKALDENRVHSLHAQYLRLDKVKK